MNRAGAGQGATGGGEPGAASRVGAGRNCAGEAELDAANQDVSRAGADLDATPQRYKIQFTASQEYVELLERARDLLSHAVPDRSVSEVHLRALRELVSKLEKKKYAASGTARRCAAVDDEHAELRRRDGADGVATDTADSRQRDGADRDAFDRAVPRQRVDSVPQGERAVPRRRDTNQQTGGTEHPRRRDGANGDAADPRRRDAVAAAVRREVRKRDGARCTFVDATGQRCRETAWLDLHHERPFARGGPATAANLSLRCRAHNALAAERDFGRDFMEGRKGARSPDG